MKRGRECQRGGAGSWREVGTWWFYLKMLDKNPRARLLSVGSRNSESAELAKLHFCFFFAFEIRSGQLSLTAGVFLFQREPPTFSGGTAG